MSTLKNHPPMRDEEVRPLIPTGFAITELIDVTESLHKQGYPVMHYQVRLAWLWRRSQLTASEAAVLFPGWSRRNRQWIAQRKAGMPHRIETQGTVLTLAEAAEMARRRSTLPPPEAPLAPGRRDEAAVPPSEAHTEAARQPGYPAAPAAQTTLGAVLRQIFQGTSLASTTPLP